MIHRLTHVPVPKVTLACTACQHVYTPNLADFDTGLTGCPLCGGWTWIAELDDAESPSVTDPKQNTLTGPMVNPPRTPVGSGAPTTSR